MKISPASFGSRLTAPASGVAAAQTGVEARVQVWFCEPWFASIS
ncbi:hypothetical protein OOK41_20320 [Micromonospora sp. NBC_01655]|nr:hypothetical protein [Micromonospora sp. NBC_01655]MCX4472623.1 hypothetical protein [Micromonospora sp. NBC_01655]